MPDFYAILQVNRDATLDEIRKSYRRQAFRYHPDKNRDDPVSAKLMFQQLTEAFDVLSDKDKKDRYDRYGVDGLRDFGAATHHEQQPSYKSNPAPSPSHSHSKSSPVFEDFSKDSHAESEDASSGRHNFQKTPPILHQLPLTLEELFSGVSKKMKVTRLRNNHQESTVLQIDVQRGWKAGTKITFQNEGDELPNAIPADIVFIIHEKKHRIFTRHGSNLHHEVNVSLKQAITGFTVEVMGIDGQKLRIRVKPLPNSSYQKVVQGHGMPLSKRPSIRGDLIVNFVVEFPRDLSNLQREQLLTNL